MKSTKTMVGGRYLKVNGKFIFSIGYFAYDGCHKIYVIESEDELKTAMEYGYYLYPIEKIRETYDCSCGLKFIESFSLEKRYVRQFEDAKWSSVKAPRKDVDAILKDAICAKK